MFHAVSRTTAPCVGVAEVHRSDYMGIPNPDPIMRNNSSNNCTNDIQSYGAQYTDMAEPTLHGRHCVDSDQGSNNDWTPLAILNCPISSVMSTEL